MLMTKAQATCYENLMDMYHTALADMTEAFEWFVRYSFTLNKHDSEVVDMTEARYKTSLEQYKGACRLYLDTFKADSAHPVLSVYLSDICRNELVEEARKLYEQA